MNKLYDRQSIGPLYNKIVLGCTIGLLIVILYALSGFNSLLFFSLNPVLIISYVLFLVILLGSNRASINSLLGIKGITFVVIFLYSGVHSRFSFDPSLIVATVAFACLFVSLYCLKELPRRNVAGETIYAGFKEKLKFIKEYNPITDRDINQKDPASMYELLPYAYCFGLNRTWVYKLKLFERSRSSGTSSYVTNYELSNIQEFIQEAVKLSI